MSAESSAQHPLNNPGSSRVVSRKRPGNGRAASEPMSANVRQDVRTRVQSMTSPQSVRNCDRCQFVSAQFPGNFRDVSTQLVGNVSQYADECPRQSLHQSWRDGLQMTS